jgi:hypothetical protein
MPGTGSPEAVGRTLEPIAAAVQPPAVPHRPQDPLIRTKGLRR